MSAVNELTPLAQVHQAAMGCVGFLIRLRQEADSHRKVGPSEQRRVIADTFQREWLAPLMSILKSIPVVPPSVNQELTSARVALGLGISQYRDHRASNAHQLVVMTAASILLHQHKLSVWLKEGATIETPASLAALFPGKTTIVVEQAASLALHVFLTHAWTVLDEFNVTQYQAELSQEYAQALQPHRSEPPPRRVRCDPSDRSVHLDGKRLASGLTEAVYAYFSVLADSYPNPITFREIKEKSSDLQGANQSRLKVEIPPRLGKYLFFP